MPAPSPEFSLTDAPSNQAPSAGEFRQLMGRFATGVCVVSLEGEAGKIAAMTVNSFVSVSLEPLLICWSLHNSSSQFDLFARAPHFAVSILAEGQGDLALRYAARADTMMEPRDFERSAGGLPVIAGALGHFECKHFAAHEAGDHTMILGEVGNLNTASSELSHPRPLAFFGGSFCSIGE